LQTIAWNLILKLKNVIWLSAITNLIKWLHIGHHLIIIIQKIKER